MRKSKKKLLAMILAFTMVFGTLPSNVFANNEQEQIHAEIEETVTTDDSAKVENENTVEDTTGQTQEEANTEEVQAEAKVEEEASSEGDADTEIVVDSSLEEIKLQKTEEIKAGEKYIIVYDNKKALATGKDNIIAVPVEIEGETVKTEITKNVIWTVGDNNNLVSELGKELSAELTLQEDNGQSFKFNEKNVYYENGEVNTYLTYNEESNKWSLEEKENEAVTYYKVVGPVERLQELTEEELDKIEEDSNEITQPIETPVEGTEGNTTEGDNSAETPEDGVEDEIANYGEESKNSEEEVVIDNTTTLAVGDVTYELDTNGIDQGAEYLIVASGTNMALKKNGSSVTSSEIDISSDGKIVTDIKEASLWTFNGSGNNFSIIDAENSLLLNASLGFLNGSWSYSLELDSSNTEHIIQNNNNTGAYSISRNIQSRWIGGQKETTSYLYYNNKFDATGTQSYVRLYKKVVPKVTLTVNFNVDGTNTSKEYSVNKGQSYTIPEEDRPSSEDYNLISREPEYDNGSDPYTVTLTESTTYTYNYSLKPTYQVKVEFIVNSVVKSSSIHDVTQGKSFTVTKPTLYHSTFKEMKTQVDGEGEGSAQKSENFNIIADNNKTVRYYYTSDEKDSVHFNATMYNYDSTKINENSRISSSRFLFLGGDTGFGSTNGNAKIYNRYIEKMVTQGILKSEFENGVPVYSDGITGPDLFSKSSNDSIGKSVYENVSFPFVYTDDGYYTFDSKSMHTHVDTSKTGEQTLSLFDGPQTVGSANEGSFFPFNSGDRNSTGDFHFGMNIDISFYMTSTGLDENGKPIRFEFSGDDDVWVFIDGKLVLDLGGIHQVQGGFINFQDGTVGYTGNNSENGAQAVTNSRRDINGNSITSTPENLYNIIRRDVLADDTEHTLQIYYLERGAGMSNCKIRFNLPQRNKVEVYKTLEQGTPITDSSFRFKIEATNKEGVYQPLTKVKYKIIGSGNDSKGETDNDGIFIIKAGQKAVFNDPILGQKYRITEIGSSGYQTRWITKVNAQLQGQTNLGYGEAAKVSPEITINGTRKANTYSFYCYNKTDFSLQDDVVVLDYGKAINIDVMTNDKIKNPSVSNLILDSVSILNENDFKSINELNLLLQNGTLTKASAQNYDFVYTPDKFMDTIEELEYKVSYSGTNADGEPETLYKIANLTIMPATTVYYEDNFTVSKDGNSYSSSGIKYSDHWVQVTTNESGKIVDNNGDFITVQGVQDDGLVGDDGKSAGLPYGYDSSYNSDAKFSNGTAMMIKKTTNNQSRSEEDNRTASFEFVGTGFDLISLTDNTTGTIIVTISKKEGNDYEQVYKKLVNNTYETPDGVLYQIPVINCYDLEYGMYEVEITVSNTNFYLDAVRIYSPLGFNNLIANSQYEKDGEANADIREIRNLLIGQGKVNDDKIKGIVYVDGKSGVEDVATYTEIGPNNEVYLNEGRAISFNLDGFNPENHRVQIGVKSPTGAAVKFKVNGENNSEKTINTATDMYYDITDYIKNTGTTENPVWTISITNSTGAAEDGNGVGDKNIVSITNIKITSKATNQQVNIVSDLNTVIRGNMYSFYSNSNIDTDFNNDGHTDIYDLAAVASNQDKEVIIGVSTDIYKQDLTRSNTINRDDLNIVRDSIE